MAWWIKVAVIPTVVVTMMPAVAEERRAPRIVGVEFPRGRAVMWRVITVLSEYIRRKDEAIADLAFHDIPGRVARKLLELASSRGEAVGSGTQIRLPLSQQSLAGLVGASRENVNRSLRRFASLGLIEIGRGHITIP